LAAPASPLKKMTRRGSRRRARALTARSVKDAALVTWARRAGIEPTRATCRPCRPFSEPNPQARADNRAIKAS
jgi:hypothetical protein